MLEQEGEARYLLQRPAPHDREGWREYWRAQQYLWRSEPEIEEGRKDFLSARRFINADIRRSIYPFKDISLTRPDVEWLLATHQDGQGPVDWSGVGQRLRDGLDLRGADLVGVNLSGLPLARAHGGLTEAERTHISAKQRDAAAVHLEGADLFEVHLEGAYLAGAHLELAELHRAYLEQASFMYAHLEGANLRSAHLEGAFLGFAHLNGKEMDEHELQFVHKREADFPRNLAPANLRHAFFDRATSLDSINLGDRLLGFVTVVDACWTDVNLAMVNWDRIPMLGDEFKLHQARRGAHPGREGSEQLREYRRAARANRQLAIALQNQGLNEEAARFNYRAQIVQREVFRRRHRYGQFLFSLFLYLLAGYGYRLVNSFLAYILVIVGFATTYYLLGPAAHIHLSPLAALVFSMTSFHGRGFSPGQNIGLDNPVTVLAACEAFVGLIIEITFIATLTQRFFRR